MLLLGCSLQLDMPEEWVVLGPNTLHCGDLGRVVGGSTAQKGKSRAMKWGRQCISLFIHSARSANAKQMQGASSCLESQSQQRTGAARRASPSQRRAIQGFGPITSCRADWSLLAFGEGLRKFSFADLLATCALYAPLTHAVSLPRAASTFWLIWAPFGLSSR